jgi:hypothetical protein
VLNSFVCESAATISVGGGSHCHAFEKSSEYISLISACCLLFKYLFRPEKKSVVSFVSRCVKFFIPVLCFVEEGSKEKKKKKICLRGGDPSNHCARSRNLLLPRKNLLPRRELKPWFQSDYDGEQA